MADLKLQVIMQLADRAAAPLRNITRGSKEAAQALKAARETVKSLNDQQRKVDGFTRQQAAMQAASDKAKVLRQNVAALTQAHGANSTQVKTAEKALAKATTEFNKQRDAAVKLRGELNKAGIGNVAQAQARVSRETAAANAQIERQTAILRRQGEQMRKLASLKERADKYSALTGTGAGMMAKGAATGYGLARFMGAGVGFDAQMSKVQALARLTKDSAQMKALREQAMALGASTSFSGGDVASGQAFLAMAGFTPEAIRAAMPGLLDMAKAGDIDLGRGADISSNILSGLGLDPEQMGKVADVLTRTFTSSNTTLDMLGQTMAYAAPVAKIYGQNLEVVSAMAGKLGDAGVQGSMAGTAIAAIMNRLAAPPKMAADAIEQLGLSTKDAAGNMRPMPDILKEIYDKTKDMGNADRGGLLKAIAGEEAVKGMATLVDQAGSGELQKFVAGLQAAQGTASKTAKVMADNLSGDLTSAKSAFESVQIAFADANSGWMRSTFQWLTDMTRGAASWAKENPALVKAITMTVAGLSALLVVGGAVLVAVGLIVGKILLARFIFGHFAMTVLPFLKLALTGLVTTLGFVAKAVLLVGRAMLLNPIGLLITAIAVAALLIYKYWGPITAFFTRVWTSITTGLSSLWQSFKTMGGQLIDGLVGGITSRMSAVRDAIGNVASSTIGWFREKLGIRSPSRVFMVAGHHLGEGAALGINRSARLVQRASAGLTAAAMVPSMAMAGARIDARPPLAAGSTSAPTVVQGDTITIQVSAAPGQDPQSLARAIAAELDRRAAAKQARSRGALTDLN